MADAGSLILQSVALATLLRQPSALSGAAPGMVPGVQASEGLACDFRKAMRYHGTLLAPDRLRPVGR